MSINLVRHHVGHPWTGNLEGLEFSFCETPACPVVYFAANGQTFEDVQLRRRPAYKSGEGADLLCFCFDVSGDDVAGQDDPTPYVRERVRKNECACNVLNPSGACCLGSIGWWKKNSTIRAHGAQGQD